MNKIIQSKFSLIILTALLVGCGGSSSSVDKQDDTQRRASLDDRTESFKIAKDNSVHNVTGEFKSYKIVVYTDATIDDKPSQSTKSIYGKINGESTASLLTINSNYSDGDSFKIKVYKDGELVGESSEEVLLGETIEFSDIEI
jgi:antitoxin component YwqK of YwqJK toxin-antitoxin module